MEPARIDLETVFATFKSFVTIPAASPYLLLFALSIASSIVLKFFIIRKKKKKKKSSSLITTKIAKKEHFIAKVLFTHLNLARAITGPKISSLAISISSCTKSSRTTIDEGKEKLTITMLKIKGACML
jgi:hypothetical protein